MAFLSLVHLVRAFIFGFLLFILTCLLYAGLPSPEVPDEAIATQLQAGIAVVRGYDIDHFHSYTLGRLPDLSSWVVVRIRYEADTRTLIINDRFIIETSSEHTDLIIPSVITAELDGVNLPWFAKADAALLSYLTHNKRGPLPVAFVARQDDSQQSGRTISDIFIGKSRDKPILTLSFDTNIPHSIPSFSFPSAPYSESPSTTFPIRKALLSFIAPIVLVVVFIAGAAGIVLKFCLSVLVVWAVWEYGVVRKWKRVSEATDLQDAVASIDNLPAQPDTGKGGDSEASEVDLSVKGGDNIV